MILDQLAYEVLKLRGDFTDVSSKVQVLIDSARQYKTWIDTHGARANLAANSTLGGHVNPQYTEELHRFSVFMG